MSTILHLIRRDARHAVRNVMAGIVIFGLVVIPSMFTWFNVLASWDPFENTRDLTVAVASTDDGYQSDLVPVRINVGEQVLSSLRANDQLNWVITSEEDAIDGTRSGEYYAAIVLPPSFSADMLTFYSDGAQRTDLAYYTNEKKSALAPKVTGQGAEGVSSQITEVFTKTLSEVGLGLVSSLSERLDDPETRAAMARMESNVSAIGTQMRAGAQTADMFSTLIEGTVPLVTSASALVSGSSAAFDDATDAVGQGVGAVGQLSSALRSTTQDVSDALATSVAGYAAVGDSIDQLYAELDSLTGAQVDVVDDLAARTQQQVDAVRTLRDTLRDDVRPQLPPEAQPALDGVISSLNGAIASGQAAHDRIVGVGTTITNGNQQAQSSHGEVTALLADSRRSLNDAQAAFTNGLAPQLDELARSLDTLSADADAIGADLDAANARLSGTSGSAVSALQAAGGATAELATALRDGAERFDTLADALRDASETGDLTALNELIGADPSVLAGALADPIDVERTAVYPVTSFGAAMMPLYLMLALWVGALLMTVAIRVDVNEHTLPGEPEPTPTQKYLGRYGIFALTGLAQSTLLTLGLILFVRVEPAHPLLLILAGWVISLVFTLIIYTFVVAFGNAGKALAVLLLVIQISGSGGAYPLELLPPWFQNISPFLPATHAIDAVRAATAGIYQSDYIVSLGLLVAFVIPTLLLGLVLRRPLIGFNRGLVEALESTKLMG